MGSPQGMKFWGTEIKSRGPGFNSRLGQYTFFCLICALMSRISDRFGYPNSYTEYGQAGARTTIRKILGYATMLKLAQKISAKKQEENCWIRICNPVCPSLDTGLIKKAESI